MKTLQRDLTTVAADRVTTGKLAGQATYMSTRSETEYWTSSIRKLFDILNHKAMGWVALSFKLYTRKILKTSSQSLSRQRGGEESNRSCDPSHLRVTLYYFLEILISHKTVIQNYSADERILKGPVVKILYFLCDLETNSL